jgi:TATA-binding protein-associated factor Taf7
LQTSLSDIEELKSENARLEQMGVSSGLVEGLNEEIASLKSELQKEKDDYKKEIERNTLIYKESIHGLERSLEVSRKELTELKSINNNLTEKFVNRETNDSDDSKLKLESLLDKLDTS